MVILALNLEIVGYQVDGCFWHNLVVRFVGGISEVTSTSVWIAASLIATCTDLIVVVVTLVIPAGVVSSMLASLIHTHWHALVVVLASMSCVHLLMVMWGAHVLRLMPVSILTHVLLLLWVLSVVGLVHVVVLTMILAIIVVSLIVVVSRSLHLMYNYFLSCLQSDRFSERIGVL